MQRLMRKIRRLSLYKKSLYLFSFILAIFGISFLVYVYKSMVIYEKGIVDNYIKDLAVNNKLDSDIDFEISDYETDGATISDGLKKLYKSDNLVIKKNSKLTTDDLYVFDIYNKDNLINTVSLKNKNSYTRMAILKVDEWEMVKNESHLQDGIYKYTITVPSDYHVYINSKELKEEDIVSEEDVKGLERLTNYVEIAKAKKYVINNLVYEPTIEITDEEGKNVEFKKENSEIKITKEFIKIENLEDAKSYIKNDFDILQLAENWSLFLTKDLKGTRNGFTTLIPYLIKDSYMYNMAKTWSSGIDITFVSNHTLKNPTFTNTKVSNFIIYNAQAFSCEVYLEKNMRVKNEDKVDIMHDRLYFIYYDGEYRLVNMEAITD